MSARRQSADASPCSPRPGGTPAPESTRDPRRWPRARSGGRGGWWSSASGSGGCWCSGRCSTGPTPGSDLFTSRGCTWSGSRSLRPGRVPSSRRWCPPGSPRARTSWRCWPGVAADKRPSPCARRSLGCGAARRGHRRCRRTARSPRARAVSTLPIAVSAVLAVFGMIFLVPIVVVGVARLAGRLPLLAAVRRAGRGPPPDPHRARGRRRGRDRRRVMALGIGAPATSCENARTTSPRSRWAPGSSPMTRRPARATTADSAQTWRRIEEPARSRDRGPGGPHCAVRVVDDRRRATSRPTSRAPWRPVRPEPETDPRFLDNTGSALGSSLLHQRRRAAGHARRALVRARAGCRDAPLRGERWCSPIAAWRPSGSSWSPTRWEPDTGEVSR